MTAKESSAPTAALRLSTMGIVSIIRAIGILFAALALTKTARASGDPPIVLSWIAPTRADCPEAAYVLGEIRRYVGGATVRQGRPIQVKATVRSVALDRWQLVLNTTDGEVEGERVFRDESCRAVADAAVVVLAWMIDPDAMANREAPPPKNPIRARLALTTPVPSVAREPAKLRPFIALGMAGDAGTLPWPALGAQARGGAAWKGFRLAVHSSYWPSRTKAIATVADGMPAGARFSLWALSLEGCVDMLSAHSIQRVALSLCVGPDVDLIHGSGFGITVPAHAAKAWLSLNAGLEVRVPLTFALHVVLRAASVVPTEREHFALRGVGEVYQPAAVAARGSIGLQLEL